MSRYLSIRFELVWAFCADGASVQILYHVYIYVNEGSNVRTRNEGNKININKRDVMRQNFAQKFCTFIRTFFYQLIQDCSF